MKQYYVNPTGQMTCGECHQPLRQARNEDLEKGVLQTCRTPKCPNNSAKEIDGLD